MTKPGNNSKNVVKVYPSNLRYAFICIEMPEQATRTQFLAHGNAVMIEYRPCTLLLLIIIPSEGALCKMIPRPVDPRISIQPEGGRMFGSVYKRKDITGYLVPAHG